MFLVIVVLLEFQRFVRHAEDVGNCFVGDSSVDDVETSAQALVLAAGLLPALVGQLEGIAEGGVGQGDGRGVGDGAGDVGDAIVKDAVDLVDGFAVSGRTGSLEASTLVDGDINEYASGLHQGEHVTLDEVRGLVARYEDGSTTMSVSGSSKRMLCSVE